MAGKVYEYHYSVSTVTAAFPIDMLRYDRATPAHETDSGVIQRSLEARWRYPNPEPLTIALVGAKPPTEARWASFGWGVGSVLKKAKQV